jgi:hypothetical protein
MQAGNAQIGRTILAALTAAVLVMSMVFLLANPAEANHQPPDDIVAHVSGSNGTNSPGYWVDYLANERGITDAACAKLDVADDEAFVMPSEPDGRDWVLLVVKQANDNYVYYDPVAGHSYPSTGDQAPGYSHIMVCSVEEPEPTTTTTEPEETTTTVPEETTTTVPEETTTTVPEETTTTVPEETTTTVPEETTTTIPDEVAALVFVTVDGKCVVDDGKGEGEINVTVSVDDAATVVIKDGDGDVVATVTEDSVVTVPEDDTYTWEATPNEGFEFADDFVSTGEVDIDACTPDEVKDLEVLPFTGAETEALAVIAAVLSGIGLLVLLATRRVEE